MVTRLKDVQTKYYILPDTKYMADDLNCTDKQITVVLYFYYFETVDRYVKYIKNIPDAFRIEIFSPKINLLDKLRELFVLNNNIGYHLKENRGRDISTLLVAARDIVATSDYVCFIHDKSANAEYLEEDTKWWIDNLWGNMLSDELYIRQIITLFEQEKDIGILFPPDPMGEYMFHWYGDTWLTNYHNTCELAKKLDLSVEIKREEMPVGMGTVFWAKSNALEKLYSLEWVYEMFPKEPLAMDGTLNHAVERVIKYAAEDMGYKSAYVMTADYGSWLLSKAQEYARALFYQLQKREYVFNMHQVKDLDSRESRMIEYTKLHRKNYIYGAGNYGKALYKFLKNKNISIDGFLVTHMNDLQDILYEIPVKEISSITADKDIGIIIGVSYEIKKDIEENLMKFGFKDFIYGF